jgi:hypothetical protein
MDQEPDQEISKDNSSARTASKAKSRSIEALRALLRGVHWGQFVSKDQSTRKRVRRGGVLFSARYGYFMKMTGVGVMADDIMIRFIPCYCPMRGLDDPTDNKVLLSGGGYYLVKADMTFVSKKGRRRDRQFYRCMICLSKDTVGEPALYAERNVMGPIA